MSKYHFIREVKEHSVISTQGDFATTSEVFIRIPGTVLPLTVEEPTNFNLHASLNVSGDPCEVALKLDDQIITTGSLLAQAESLLMISMQFTIQLRLEAGDHLLELQARALEGSPNIPEGPREWSPRKNKKLPRRSVFHASPGAPIIVRLIG